MHHHVVNILAWVKLGLFYLVNGIFTIIRNLIWRCTGTHAEVIKRQKNPDYALNSHKMRILMPYIVDIIYPIDMCNFLLVHDSFVDPEYVLRDDVTLLQVTKTYAIFIQKNSKMEPAFADKFSFATEGQIATGRYVIKMPLKSFLDLAEKMENNEEKIVLLHNIGRCGGTLLTSCFRWTGRAVGWNEPRVLDNVIRLAYHAWDRKSTRRVLRATFLMLAKTYRGFDGETLAYAMKPTSFLCSDADLICEAIPKAKRIFLYRDVNAAAESGTRACLLVPTLYVLQLSPMLRNPQALAFCLHAIGTTGTQCESISYRYDVILEYMYRVHLNAFKAYLRMREKGIQILAVRYEDLKDDPDRVLPPLLKVAGIPDDLVPLAKKAFISDSQSQMAFSREGMSRLRKHVGNADVCDDFLDEMQELYEKSGVPGPLDWKEKMLKLPGTV